MRLTTDGERGRFIAALSIGAKLAVVFTAASGTFLDGTETSDTFEAEVIDKVPGHTSTDPADVNGRTTVQITVPDCIGGVVVDIWHHDGESFKLDRDPREDGFAHGCYVNVAPEQADPIADEPEPVVTALVIRETDKIKAVAAMQLPPSAAEVMTLALRVEEMADQVKKYGGASNCLRASASHLRSAVGHMLTEIATGEGSNLSAFIHE
jgi:hypothetical protein